jgi:hypothetical protein
MTTPVRVTNWNSMLSAVASTSIAPKSALYRTWLPAMGTAKS